MATRSQNVQGFASQIDWALVGLAGVMAVVLVLSTTLAAWVACRSSNSIGRASRSEIGPGGFPVRATPSAADRHSPADRGNEEEVADVSAGTNKSTQPQLA